MGDKAVKFNEGKAQWSLLFDNLRSELEQVVRVMEHGAEKYTRNNWCKELPEPNFYKDALFRHLMVSDRLDESGHTHLAHAACCLLMHMWHCNKEEALKEMYEGAGRKPGEITPVDKYFNKITKEK